MTQTWWGSLPSCWEQKPANRIQIKLSVLHCAPIRYLKIGFYQCDLFPWVPSHLRTCVPVCMGVHLSNQRERGLHERATRSGTSLGCKMTWITLPMSHPETGMMEMVQWPFLLPHDMVSWMEYNYLFFLGCFRISCFNGAPPIVMLVAWLDSLPCRQRYLLWWKKGLRQLWWMTLGACPTIGMNFWRISLITQFEHEQICLAASPAHCTATWLVIA